MLLVFEHAHYALPPYRRRERPVNVAVTHRRYLLNYASSDISQEPAAANTIAFVHDQAVAQHSSCSDILTFCQSIMTAFEHARCSLCSTNARRLHPTVSPRHKSCWVDDEKVSRRLKRCSKMLMRNSSSHVVDTALRHLLDLALVHARLGYGLASLHRSWWRYLRVGGIIL